MMSDNKNFKDKLKDLGIEVYTAAKKEYDAVVNTAKKDFKDIKLRRRFNLENPHRFLLLDSKNRIKALGNIFAKHAKKYVEDDIFVFYGSKFSNDLEVGHQIKDLSDDAVYEIMEVIDVTIPVTLDHKVVDTECTAVYCEVK